MANNLEVVVRVRDLTTQGLARISQSITKMGSQMLRWGTAFTGISSALSVVQFTKFASELENLEGRLAGVFEGDLKAGADQLERIRALAADPIVGTSELVNTFIQGATAIRGFSEETLNTLANVAVQFDRDIGSVFTAFASGSERTLNQLGVSITRVGDQVQIASGQFKTLVDDNKDAIREGLVDVWSKAFPNAVEDASRRFSGAMAIFKDSVEDLGAEIGERILPRITVELNKLTAWVDQNDETIIEFAEKAASGFGAAADGIASMATAIRDHEKDFRILERFAGVMLVAFGPGFKAKALGGALLVDNVLDLTRRNAELLKQRADSADFVGPPAPLSGEDMAAMLGFPPAGIVPRLPSAPRIPTIPGITATGAGSGGSSSGAKQAEIEMIGLEVDKLGERFRSLKIDIEAAWLAAPVDDFSYSIQRAFGNARAEIDLTNQDVQDFASETITGIKSAFTDDFAKGLADMMNGVRGFEESWKGAVTSVLEGLQLVILKMISMAAYQQFIAPLLGGFLGSPALGASVATAGALTAPASFRAGAQPVVINAHVAFNAGFVDPAGANEFFTRNRDTLKGIATGAVVEAIDRVPSFRARVKG